MPVLRSFLRDKDGSNADAYENLDVVFIRGRQAVLTIYDVPEAYETSEAGDREGWVEKEKIVLSDYKTKDKMHALMVQKGFPLKSDFEREVLRQLWDWKSELELNNDIPDASEVAEMRQKIEEQLRNKESSRSEL